MLKNVARWSYAHRRLMVLVWIGLLVVVQFLAHVDGGVSSMNFKLPASDSQAAQNLLAQKFPAVSGAGGQMVFYAPAGLETPAIRSEVEATLTDVRAVPHVLAVTGPYPTSSGSSGSSGSAGSSARRQISRDGNVGYAQIDFDVQFQHLPKTSATQIEAIAAAHQSPRLTIALSGSMFQSRSLPGLTELVGIGAAIVILLIAFGSVLAMGLPILVALFGIGIGLGLVTLLANVMSMPTFAGTLAAMIGIGVGIDYALFIVTRYRQDLHEGMAPDAAVVQAILTSGKAVVFAGSIVVVSLLGMFAMGISFVRGLAVGASFAVVVTMLASITLLPAVLGFVGTGIDRLGLPWTKRASASAKRGFWYRWSRLIQKRPWPFAIVGLGLLLMLAVPLFSIRLGNSDAGNLPTTDTTRVAYDLLAKGFGPGYNGPLLVAVEVPTTAAKASLPALHDALASTAGVAFVTAPRFGPAGDVAVMSVFPTSAPQDKATVDLIHHLRHTVIPPVVAASGAVVHIGGATATFDDLSTYLGARLPVFIMVVLGLSFLLLLAVFRSVVVPLKAVIMNVLSIGAAYGVLVGVFQWGVGKNLIGLGKTGPIEAFVPMMMFAILFGLSMDYEVFLLSRIKEEWDRTHDNGQAVADGLSYTARVITAAAAIMVCVFGSFIFGGERVIKEFGMGLAVAILIDATLVRLVLVPATMELLGNANWWFPRWLERVVPRIQIEAGWLHPLHPLD